MQLKETAKSSTFMAKRTISSLFSSPRKSLAPSASFPSTYSPSFHSRHTFSQSMMEETIENAESVIKKWDPNSSSYTKVISIFQQSRKEAKDFLRSIRELRRAMHFLVSQHSHSEKLVLAQNLMQMAMGRLEREFYQILSSNRDQLDPESVSGRSSNGSSNSDYYDDIESEDEELQKAGESITEVERASALVMSDLKAIAECMISCGYGKECVQIYKLLRKSIVDEGLHMLEIENYKAARIQRVNRDSLEHMIKNWVKAMKIAVKTLFHGEKLLCDHVFSASATIRESCFYEITKEGATHLFRFPEVVAKGKNSPDRIFRLMELHQALCENWQDIESIFHHESMSAVRLQVLSSMHKLADSIHCILSDFESTIHKDSSKTSPGGGIHPLTRSAMSFISSLAENSGVLSQIIAERPLTRPSPLPESYFGSPTTASDDEPAQAVSVHLAWFVLVLLCKLDRKAELYKDVAASYLFLANNLRFITNEVGSTRLRDLLGDEWIERQDKKVQSFVSHYEIAAWAKVFSSLPEKSSMLSPQEAEQHFRQFHAAFEEAYTKQSSWIVADGKLRDELKVSIAKKLVPEYREFYEKYVWMLSQEKNSEMLVRFGPDNLENYLSDLFHGTPILSGSSSTSSSCGSRGCVPR